MTVPFGPIELGQVWTPDQWNTAWDGKAEVSDTISLSLSTTQTVQSELALGAASANYVQVSGHAGNPRVTAVGSGTNIGFNVSGKGTGGVNLQSGNGTLAFFNDNGGGAIVNAFQFNATSGTSPAIFDVIGGRGFNIRSPWSSSRSFSRSGLWTDSIAQRAITFSPIISGTPLDTGTMPTSLWTIDDTIKTVGHATAMYFNPRYGAGHTGARTGFYVNAGTVGAPFVPPDWAPDTVYALGDIVVNGGHGAAGSVYQAKVAGTSASSGGPTGTGATITDGTVTWQWGSGWQQHIYYVGGVIASTANVNGGGTAPTSGLCVGNNFGANISSALESGASNYVGNIVCEFDNRIEAGASASVNVGISLAHVPQHVNQGTEQDTCLLIADAAGAGVCVGWRNVITVGSYAADWPCDQNVGYVFQVQNNTRYAATAAGGFDLNQLTVPGSGPEGGGFYWRSPGTQIKDNEIQVAYGDIGTDANGVLLNAPWSQMTAAAGAIGVASSSSDWSTNDIAVDIYGNVYVVQTTPALGPAPVTSIKAINVRGWSKGTPPSDPITVTARVRTGPVFGSSLTLNLGGAGAWTAKNALTIGDSGTSLGFCGAAPVAKPTGVPVTAAGIHAALVSLGLIAA